MWYLLPRESYRAASEERGAAPEEGLSNCEEALSRDILESLANTGFASSGWINQQAEHRRNQAEWKRLNNDAEACSFDIVRRKNSILGITERTDSGDAPWYPYVFEYAGDVDMVKAAMLTANACLLVTRYKHNIKNKGWSPICSDDALGILARRWGEPALDKFLSGTLTSQDSGNAQALCMWELRNNLEAPITAQSFRKAVMRAHEEHLKDVKKLERDQRDARRREQKNREIERQRREIDEKNERIRERAEREGRGGGCTLRGVWYPRCY